LIVNWGYKGFQGVRDLAIYACRKIVSLLLPNFHLASSVYKQLVVLNTLRHRTLIGTARVTPFRDVTLHTVKIMLCCSCVFGSVLQPTPMYYFRCPFACVIPLKYYSPPSPHKPLLPLVPLFHFLSLKHSLHRLILKWSVPGIHARTKSLSVTSSRLEHSRCSTYGLSSNIN